MATKGDSDSDETPIRRLTAFAAKQHGVIAVWQVRQVDLSESALRRRARSGWLTRIHRGVYAVGHGVVTIESRWMAAVLAYGPKAVLSHSSAAALWRIRPGGAGQIDVTVPTQAGRRTKPGTVVHRSTSLTIDHVARRQGIPVTSPARTLLDMAPKLSARALERAVDEAARLSLCGVEDLAAVIAADRGRRGRRRLLEVLRRHRIGSTLTRSELEEKFLALCRVQRLPAPLVNARLIDLTVDFFWPEAGVVVEVDGRESHLNATAFQEDRDRDSRLAAQGFRTVRFTWWDVTKRPRVIGDRLRRLLQRR